jgi:riboflavin kinase/FMN adenylyltransferase
MRNVRDLHHLPAGSLKRPAVTLGVFDGVHRGHRRVFAELASVAERLGGERVVVTFDRHPRAALGQAAPPLITSLDHRLALFEKSGIDAAVVLRFDAELARLGAEDFVRDLLVGRIGARAIVLGRDAHFGRGRGGDVTLLERLSGPLGFELCAVDLLAAGSAGEAAVSSTAIRAAIRAGRLDEARAMLGRPVSLLGRVVRGDARGRLLGFPTANLDLCQELTPPRGVYAGEVEVDGVVFPTMQNLGLRPTVCGAGDGAAERLEVHLLGFDADLYGRVLEVAMLRRLRDEVRFPSLADLEAQLARDRDQALGIARPRV